MAKEAHVSGKVLGKAVLLELAAAGKAPETVMCVLRAPDHIELGRIAAATGCATARVLSEAEVRVWPIPLRRACPPPSGSFPPTLSLKVNAIVPCAHVQCCRLPLGLVGPVDTMRCTLATSRAHPRCACGHTGMHARLSTSVHQGAADRQWPQVASMHSPMPPEAT